MQSKPIHHTGAVLLFSIVLALPAAGNGLLVNALVGTANICNNSTGDITSTTGPTLSASGTCSSPNFAVSDPSLGTGVDSVTSSAAAFASFGMIGASVDTAEVGTESVMPSVVGYQTVIGALAVFTDTAFLNIVGLPADAPVTLTFGFTLSGLSTATLSPTFSGNNAPSIAYNIALYLAQEANPYAGDTTSVNAFNGNPLLAGVYTVSTTVLNDEDIFLSASLSFQVYLPVLPLGAGAFGANIDADFLNTAQLTTIGISDGTNSYTNYSLIGSSNNTNYQQVLTEGDAATPEPGSMGLIALGAAMIAWLVRKQAAQA